MFDQTLSAPIQPQYDHPLSAKGRFNRLSYLGWYGLLSVSWTVLFILIATISASLSVNNVEIHEPILSAFSGIGGIALIALWFAGFYFQIIFLIRRLHDLNKTGWLCLLLLVPILQFFFTLYVLFAAGTPHRNDYGDVRPSTTWEKLFAWIMIIFSLMMIFGMFIFSYYFASPDFWGTPTQILQNTTEYF
jgi:uncharacterized membrane protein YhaH (DUF805 family)